MRQCATLVRLASGVALLLWRSSLKYALIWRLRLVAPPSRFCVTNLRLSEWRLSDWTALSEMTVEGVGERRVIDDTGRSMVENEAATTTTSVVEEEVLEVLSLLLLLL
jgi:hypothetical protein